MLRLSKPALSVAWTPLPVEEAANVKQNSLLEGVTARNSKFIVKT